ncbi:MAG: acetyl-CoA C-acyltransferase [Cytophagales bacterium]|nr:acetyl-CoA C-acyltransferase [Cytophagales bacterium]
MGKEVFIVSLARTPLGSFGGQFSGLTSTELGSIAIRGALDKLSFPLDQIDEVFFGNVLSAGLGQAPARQASLGAGIGHEVPCTTINKVCASGLKAIMLGAQSIAGGENHVVIAGGMESMSNVPYYLPQARFGYKYGSGELIDGLFYDGLREAYQHFPMGNCGEKLAKEMGITREEQDEYAIQSYQRAEKAVQEGSFKGEIVSVEVPQRKGEKVAIEEDEEYKKVSLDKIPKLRPVFAQDGTITAANASTLSDGAACVVLLSGEKVKELGLKPLARILSFADAAQEPTEFTTAPAAALPKALLRAGISQDEIDLYEINEAFSVVALANMRILGLDQNRVNVLGGAVALGHPLGCSGARILCTLHSALEIRNLRKGAAAICNGGGGASCLLIERI